MFQTGRSVQLSNTPALRPFTKTCMTIARARFKIPARVKTDPILNNYLPQTMEDSARSVLKAETHDATRRLVCIAAATGRLLLVCRCNMSHEIKIV